MEPSRGTSQSRKARSGPRVRKRGAQDVGAQEVWPLAAHLECREIGIIAEKPRAAVFTVEHVVDQAGLHGSGGWGAGQPAYPDAEPLVTRQ